MQKRHLKAQRTRLLEQQKLRCQNRHPNYFFIRCEFSVEERHNQHIGENGRYVWQDEVLSFPRRFLDAKGKEINADL